MAIIQRNTPNVIFYGLSSFWTAFFKDSAVLKGLYDATSSEIGNCYLELMENLLGVAIKDAPVYSKKDWRLLMLDTTKLSFDPAVYSWASTDRLASTLRFQARELGPTYDDHSITVSDFRSLSLADKNRYPVAGIYNREQVLGGAALENSWVYRVQDDSLMSDAVGLLNRRFVTNKPISQFHLVNDVVLGLERDGNQYEATLGWGLTSGVSSLAEMVSLLQNAVNATGILGVTVSSSGDFILFEAPTGTLKLVSSNQGAEALYLKAFPFNVTHSVPQNREAEFEWVQSSPISLRTAGYRAPGTEWRFEIDADIVESKFIYNALYDPTVILESGRHYRLATYDRVNYIYFDENPFEFDNVARRDLGTSQQIALWMSEISRDKLDLFKNFGYMLNIYEESSQAYKDFLRGVMYYFTHGPQVTRIESCLSLIAGIPVVLEEGEIVLAVESTVSENIITTDRNRYVLPKSVEPSVLVGQILSAFDPLTAVFKVVDYVNSPKWFEQALIPDRLMPGAPEFRRQVLEHIHVPLIGDPGYVIGDLATANPTLTTQEVRCFGPNRYVLPEDAKFTIEFDKSSIRLPIVVRKSLTTSNTSLENLVGVLRRELKQLRMRKVSRYALTGTATFEIRYLETTYPISLTVAETSSLSSFTEILNLVNSKLVASGVPHITAIDLGEECLTFSPAVPVDFTITNPNVYAQTELGIQALSTPRFYEVKGYVSPYPYIVIASKTFGSKASVEITEVNEAASRQLGFNAFRTGSGDIIGNEGDPSVGWRIFDGCLKYNVFGIQYDVSLAPPFRDPTYLTDIVVEGRPLYTFALVTSKIPLEDTIATETSIVTDVQQFVTDNSGSMKVGEREAQIKASVVMTYPEGQWHQEKNLSSRENFPQPVAAKTTQEQIGGVIKFRAKTESHRDVEGHTIHVRNISSLSPEESLDYGLPGIYNEGRVLGRRDLGPFWCSGATVGGVYQRTSYYQMRTSTLGPIFPEEETAIHPHATAFLVVERPVGNPVPLPELPVFDPVDPLRMPVRVGDLIGHADADGAITWTLQDGQVEENQRRRFYLEDSGITEGMMLELTGFAHNNGVYPIRTISRNVEISGVMCDVFWFTKYPESMGDPYTIDTDGTMHLDPEYAITEENYGTATLSPDAAFSIKRWASPKTKVWYFVVPNDLTIKESVDAAYAGVGNDEADFPFTVTMSLMYQGMPWEQTLPVRLITEDPVSPRMVRGDLYSLSPKPAGASPNAFFVGDPRVRFGDAPWVFGYPDFQFGVEEQFQVIVTGDQNLPSNLSMNLDGDLLTPVTAGSVVGHVTGVDVTSWTIEDEL